jgi:hypothetical protein
LGTGEQRPGDNEGKMLAQPTKAGTTNMVAHESDTYELFSNGRALSETLDSIPPPQGKVEDALVGTDSLHQ